MFDLIDLKITFDAANIVHVFFENTSSSKVKDFQKRRVWVYSCFDGKTFKDF